MTRMSFFFLEKKPFSLFMNLKGTSLPVNLPPKLAGLSGKLGKAGRRHIGVDR